MPQLRQIDANLLVALDVLLEERHVTRAAQRLGVTQSAMSQTLQRLRVALDDPVLVRAGTRMVPSPRAKALAGPLHAALQGLDALLADEVGFDPRAAQRVFRMASLDTYSISLLPPFLQRLADAGPGLELDVHPLDLDQVWEIMRRGVIELAIVGPWPVPADMHSAPLLDERMIGMVRADHPLLDGPIDAESYVRWPHVVTRLTGRGGYAIDRRLAEMGLERRIIGRTPYFLAAPAIVAESDLIVTVPRSAARAFARQWPVRLFEPPIGAPMDYTVSLAWPAHLERDPGHQWLRERLLAIGAELSAV